jgi:hypothetical protein
MGRSETILDGHLGILSTHLNTVCGDFLFCFILSC